LPNGFNWEGLFGEFGDQPSLKGEFTTLPTTFLKETPKEVNGRLTILGLVLMAKSWI